MCIEILKKFGWLFDYSPISTHTVVISILFKQTAKIVIITKLIL